MEAGWRPGIVLRESSGVALQVFGLTCTTYIDMDEFIKSWKCLYLFIGGNFTGVTGAWLCVWSIKREEKPRLGSLNKEMYTVVSP